ILAARDDRRVRDRDAEWVAEQRGDGEPVSETTDHGGFSGGANEGEPRELSLERQRKNEQDRRTHEQARGPPLHAVELDLLVGVFLVNRDERYCRRRRQARGRRLHDYRRLVGLGRR